MKTHPAKRVEIVIEAAMRRRLADALDDEGYTGYTILPVLGGSGRAGRWSREGEVGRAGMVVFIVLVGAERLDGLMSTAFSVVTRHIGVVSICDCEVVRPERF